MSVRGDWKVGRADDKEAHFFPTDHWWSICTRVKRHVGIIVHSDTDNIDYCPECKKMAAREE